MPNYYETLHVIPTATAQEIEPVIDRLYNETRRKVTNFDPQVAAQANQALLVLEQMRTTLLNPQLRAEYDKTLDLNMQMGGLLDPDSPPVAIPSASSLGMPSGNMAFGSISAGTSQGRQSPQVAPQGIIAPKTTWTCPQCHVENPPQTLFCKSCGGEVGLTCPKCHKTYEVATTQFCSSCGSHLATEVHRKRLQDRLSLAENDLQTTQATDPRRDNELSLLRAAILQSFAWVALLIVFRLIGIPILNALRVRLDTTDIFVGNGMRYAALWGGLAVVTIAFAILLRARWTAAWGALFAAFLWGSTSLFLFLEAYYNNSYSDTSYGYSGYRDVQLGVAVLLLLVDLVLAAQPRKFAKSFTEWINKPKGIVTISHVFGWIFALIVAAQMGTWLSPYYFRLGDPLGIYMITTFLHTGIYCVLGVILLWQGVFGLGIVNKVNNQVRNALLTQTQRIKELTSEVESLKQDLTHISR